MTRGGSDKRRPYTPTGTTDSDHPRLFPPRPSITTPPRAPGSRFGGGSSTPPTGRGQTRRNRDVPVTTNRRGSDHPLPTSYPPSPYLCHGLGSSYLVTYSEEGPSGDRRRSEAPGPRTGDQRRNDGEKSWSKGSRWQRRSGYSSPLWHFVWVVLGRSWSSPRGRDRGSPDVGRWGVGSGRVPVLDVPVWGRPQGRSQGTPDAEVKGRRYPNRQSDYLEKPQLTTCVWVVKGPPGCPRSHSKKKNSRIVK